MSVIVYADIDINYHKIKFFFKSSSSSSNLCFKFKVTFLPRGQGRSKKIIFSISFFEFIYKIKCDLSYN